MPHAFRVHRRTPRGGSVTGTGKPLGTAFDHERLPREHGAARAPAARACLRNTPTAPPPRRDIDFERGMQVAGRLDFLSVKADVDARLSPGNGVRAQVDLAPITVGDAKFFQLTGAVGKGGPQLSVATYFDVSAPADRREPHAFVRGAIRLLGVSVASARLMGSKSGLVFRVEGNFQPLSSVRLDVTATSPSQASLEGRATVPVTLGAVNLGSLGTTVPFASPVTVTLGVAGSVTGGTASTSVTATFTAFGLPITTPAIPLSVPLLNVESILVGPMGKAIAGALNADKWIELVGKGSILLTSFAPIAEVLVKHFGKSLGETVKILGALGASVSQLARWLAPLLRGRALALQATPLVQHSLSS